MKSVLLEISPALQILRVTPVGNEGVKHPGVVLGRCPIDRKILLGSDPQRRFVGVDGLLQIRGTVSGGQLGIRSAEVVLDRCPIDRKIPLGSDPQRRFVGVDGLVGRAKTSDSDEASCFA